MEDVIEFKGGKKVVVPKKMFPGYLLVRCDLDDDSWYVVRNTPGVTGFVGLGRQAHAAGPQGRRDVPRGQARGHRGHRPRRPGRRLEYEVGESVRVQGRPVRRLLRPDRRDQRGPAQAQGARQHLRAGDPGRARVQPGRQALGQRPAPSKERRHGEEARRRHRQDPDPRRARPRRPRRSAPRSAPTACNTMDFCKQYNAATESQRGTIIPVEITIFEDRSFTFIIKTPPTPVLLRAGRRPRQGRADARAGRSAGTVTDAQLDRDRPDQDARPQRQRPRGGQEAGGAAPPARWASRCRA